MYLKDGYNSGTDNRKHDKDMKKLELLYFAGENIKWYIFCGKHFGSSSKS